MVMQEEAKAKREATPHDVVEEVLEKKLSDITTVLYNPGNGTSRLYEEIITMVERCLFKIALARNNNIKGAAANYLGINRNTFQKKMVKLGLQVPHK